MSSGRPLTIHKLLIYYVYGVVSFTLVFSLADGATNKFYHRIWSKKTYEEKMKLLSLLFLHNIVFFTLYFTSFYIIWGFMRNLYRKQSDILEFCMVICIYILYTVGTLYHWKSNNDRCELTVIQNRLLEIEEGYAFRDWISILTNNYPKLSKGSDSNFRSRLFHIALIFNIATSLFILLSLAPKLF
mgnify:CR=1 FL=1